MPWDFKSNIVTSGRMEHSRRRSESRGFYHGGIGGGGSYTDHTGFGARTGDFDEFDSREMDNSSGSSIPEWRSTVEGMEMETMSRQVPRRMSNSSGYHDNGPSSVSWIDRVGHRSRMGSMQASNNEIQSPGFPHRTTRPDRYQSGYRSSMEPDVFFGSTAKKTNSRKRTPRYRGISDMRSSALARTGGNGAIESLGMNNDPRNHQRTRYEGSGPSMARPLSSLSTNATHVTTHEREPVEIEEDHEYRNNQKWGRNQDRSAVPSGGSARFSRANAQRKEHNLEMSRRGKTLDGNRKSGNPAARACPKTPTTRRRSMPDTEPENHSGDRVRDVDAVMEHVLGDGGRQTKPQQQSASKTGSLVVDGDDDKQPPGSLTPFHGTGEEKTNDPEWAGDLFLIASAKTLPNGEVQVERRELGRDPNTMDLRGINVDGVDVSQWTHMVDNSHDDTEEDMVRHREQDMAEWTRSMARLRIDDSVGGGDDDISGTARGGGGGTPHEEAAADVEVPMHLWSCTDTANLWKSVCAVPKARPGAVVQKTRGVAGSSRQALENARAGIVQGQRARGFQPNTAPGRSGTGGTTNQNPHGEHGDDIERVVPRNGADYSPVPGSSDLASPTKKKKRKTTATTTTPHPTVTGAAGTSAHSPVGVFSSRTGGVQPRVPDAMFINPLAKDLAKMVLVARKIHRDDVQKRKLKDRMEVEQIDDRQSDSVPGMKCFEDVYRLADSFRDKRSPDQVEFHDKIFQTCAPHIIGKVDYPRVRQMLMKRFGRNESNMAALILTPRRWGKTTAVAMALACIMYCARGVVIVVFSTGQEMSTTLMKKVQVYYRQLAGADARVVTSSKAEFITTHSGVGPSENKLEAARQGRVNKMLARAGTVKGNKGVSFDIAVLEEASRIDEGILGEVIAPMMKVGNSVLIALSTHLGEDNYYTKLFESNHPATKRLFLRLRVELMCAKCKRKGVDPSECKCLEHLHPPWLLGSNAERAQILMGGDQKMYAQEVLGVVFSSQECIFDKKWLAAFKARPARPLPTKKGCFITTFIDPAGSGDSCTAICSVVRMPTTPDVFIVGLAEARPQTVIDMREMVKVYFENMYRDNRLRGLDHVVCSENNYGGPCYADSIITACSESSPVQLYEYRTNGTLAGTHTNQSNKRDSALCAIVDMHDNNIHFHEPLVSLSLQSSDIQTVKDQFHDQCSQISKKITKTGNWTYSGKGPGGKRDDMFISYVFASYFSKDIPKKQQSRQAWINSHDSRLNLREFRGEQTAFSRTSIVSGMHQGRRNRRTQLS